MDVTKLGQTVMEMMESLGEGNAEECEVGVVAVVVEIHHPSMESTEIAYRCSDARRWLQIGLFESAVRAVTDSSESPDE
jgi:hypothetical protein